MGLEGGKLTAAGHASGITLLCEPGGRPTAVNIERLLESTTADHRQPARISHRPVGSEGWLELLASGLTFDLLGLVPAPTVDAISPRHRFGLPNDLVWQELEAVRLEPAVHVASGAAMIPVVRVMAGLAERLCAWESVRAVCWNPAGIWMEVGYFVRLIRAWLVGGAFPALGLTGIERTADGGMETVGLCFFTGQELRVEPVDGQAPADAVKLAVRAVDMLVRHGRVDKAFNLTGPGGEPLRIEPDPGGGLLRLWQVD